MPRNESSPTARPNGAYKMLTNKENTCDWTQSYNKQQIETINETIKQNTTYIYIYFNGCDMSENKYE